MKGGTRKGRAEGIHQETRPILLGHDVLAVDVTDHVGESELVVTLRYAWAELRQSDQAE